MAMRYALLLGFGLLWTAPAQAAMLDPVSVDASRLLPPPPAEGSIDSKAEFQELRDIAKRSTPDMIATATRDAKNETPTLFNDTVGFDIAALPQTNRLLTLVAEEEDADTKMAKDFFHRERPYAVDPSLKTCTPVKPGKAPTSYPSGHASLAFSMAIVLASLVPAKSQAILARATEYAENRPVCGGQCRGDLAE